MPGMCFCASCNSGLVYGRRNNMKKRIRKFIGAMLLCSLSLMPCLSFAYDAFTLPGETKSLNDMENLSDEVVEFKNPSWAGEYQEISSKEYLYLKYFYYKGKYYDLNLKGHICVPEKLKFSPYTSGDKITVTIIENGTENIADLDNFFYGFIDMDSYEKTEFSGDITSHIYKPKGVASSDVVYSYYEGKTEITSINYNMMGTANNGESEKGLSYYIKSDVSENNQLQFTHSSTSPSAGYFTMKFFLLEEEYNESVIETSADSVAEASTAPVVTSEPEPEPEPELEPALTTAPADLAQSNVIGDIAEETSANTTAVAANENLASQNVENNNEGYDTYNVNDEYVEADEYDEYNDEDYDFEDYEDEYEFDEKELKNGKHKLVKTGDNKNISVYSFVLLVSIALLKVLGKTT